MQYAIESDAHGPRPVAARGKWFWFGWGAVAASQLVAFWLLCNNQVRVAEARRSELQVQAMALAECLQQTPRSTVASCTASRTPTVVTVMSHAAVTATPVQGAIPVNFSFR